MSSILTLKGGDYKLIVKALKITEIALTKIDSKHCNVELQINFANDSPLRMNAHLDDDYELFISKLLKTVKSAKQVDTEYDNDNSVLKGVSILTIVNEEDIKEIAPKRLNLINNRVDSLKRTKSASEYMQLYSQLSTLKEVIYQSCSSL